MAHEGFSWTAPEFHYFEKTAVWYWVVGVVAVLITLFAFLQDNFLFAVFTIIAGLLVLTWGGRKPHTGEFAFDHNGLAFNGKQLYALDELTGFAIIGRAHGGMGEIVMKTKRKTSIWVRMLVPESELEAVTEAFRSALPEVPHEESLVDYFVHLLRF